MTTSRGRWVMAFAAIAVAASGAMGRAVDEWPATGNDAAGAYHSELADINTGNVARLGFAWDYRLGTHRGLEATPVVVGGVLYAVGNFGRVYALDAANGHERWVYDPHSDGQWGRYACCDAVNRGVAVAKGRVYVTALDGYLHAIDAATGRLVWKTDTLPARGPTTPYTTTGVPVIAGDLIVVGAGGGDFKGVRGYVAAFDLATGHTRWRLYTVPRNPALGPQDQPHLTTAVGTWDPRHRWEMGAGGAVWDGIAYDPKLKLVYVGTGNASPYDVKQDGRHGGDNLYTDSILAVHAATGTLAWHFQAVPNDMWDFDSTQKLILADVDVAPDAAHGTGAGRHAVVMQAAKNGFFYVLDRQTGAFLSANNFAYQNWTRGLDPATGRPTPTDAVDYSAAPKLVFPWEGGAHGWQPMAYEAKTQRVFLPVQEAPNVIVETERRRVGLVEGQFTSPAFLPEVYDPKGMAGLFGPLPALEELTQDIPPEQRTVATTRRGFLKAWDVARNRELWSVPSHSGWDGGVMATAGGLVFQGDAAGMLNIYESDSGKLLKSVDLGTSVMAAPMTYRIGGVQYVALLAGYGGGDMGYAFPDGSAAQRYGNEGRVIALKLDGGEVPHPPVVAMAPFPPPPPRAGTAAQIASGEILYNRYCSRCHVMGQGMLPDLRRLTPEKHGIFDSIVRGGALSGLGMGRFDDVLSAGDVESLHDYLIDESWKVQGTL